MDDLAVAAAGERLRAAKTVSIVSHQRPDGDAVGSALGLALALEAAGKTVTVALADGVPSSFQHLAGADRVVRQGDPHADCKVMVDCGDITRGGSAWLPDWPIDINIDHHKTNTHFAAVNIVVPDAVATAAMLAELIPQWGFEITPESASALLTGMLTDTIGFRTSNMTSHALRLAADLVDKGAPLSELYFKALVERSFEALRYWGQGLSRIRREDGLVWTSLTLEDRKISGYNGNDDADLVGYLVTVRGAAIGVIFVEQPDGTVKVSWRARPGWDVSQIAVRFGGGGHAPAAGATVPGSLDEVQSAVLTATRELLTETL
ncbi:MAG: hypothetical protein GXO56_05710 [Chloroflexi bacterium]|nr:hypothetical protein [Chloroflexota bacterium]